MFISINHNPIIISDMLKIIVLVKGKEDTKKILNGNRVLPTHPGKDTKDILLRMKNLPET